MKARFILVLAILMAACTARADIVINEIMQDPAAVADGNGEWFELYNTAETTADLSDWTITDNGGDSFTITSAMIEGHGFLVLGANGDPNVNGGVPVDVVYLDAITLDDTADEIILTDADGNLADMVEYDSGAGFPDPAGASMALNDPAMDNNLGANWSVSEYAWPESAGDFGSPGEDNNPVRDLRNWSFEEFNADGPEGWTFELFNIIDYTPNTEFVHHGDTSMQVTMDAYQSVFSMSQTIYNPAPGDFWNATAWVLDNTTGSSASLEVKLFDANGNLIGQYVGANSEDSPDWQQISEGVFVYDETVSMEFTLHFAANFMFGESTFYVDQAELSVEATPAEIQADPMAYDGARVHTSGLITQGTNTVHMDYCDGYLQHEGTGLMLFDPEPLANPLMRGDSVMVSAEVDEVLGVTQLTDFAATITNTGNPLPEPWLAPSGVFTTSLANEGVWSELTGELTTAPGDPGTTYSVMLDDGSGPAEVQIWADAGLDLSGLDMGDNLRVRGTMDMGEGIAVLQPSMQEDIDTIPDGVDFSIIPTSGDIPPGGGTVNYDASLANNTGQSYNGLVAWRSVLAPNGTLYGPFMTTNFTMPAGFNVTLNDISQMVPAMAPQGTYVVYHNIGLNTGTSYVWDQFAFTKTGAAVSSTEPLTNADWTDATTAAGGFDAAATSAGEPGELPQEYALAPLTPNPFNPSATVRVDLPEAGELNVTVFNVRGQKVATLTDGRAAAGSHQFTLDGSTLASGVYIVRASVPGEWNAVRKAMLVK